MSDKIFLSFLEAQFAEATALAAATDSLRLTAQGAPPPRNYVAQFHCRGLIRTPSGQIEEADVFDVGIHFPDDYLRHADSRHVVTIFRPWTIWHPNASGPFICLGRLTGGTPLVDILYQCYEIITYQKWAAHDGLNHAACEWARNNQERLPIDRRPLKWRGAQP